MKYSNLIIRKQGYKKRILDLIEKLILVVFFLSSSQIYGQEIHSKITILNGGSVPISFNSYTKMFNGIEYTDWTRLRILYFDTLNDGSLTAGSTWKLLVRSNSINIPGDDGAPMSLDKVELSVSTVTDDGTLAPLGGYIALSNSDQQLVSNGANPTGRDVGVTIGNNTEILVTYRVGGNGGPPGVNTVLGESSGYYYVDLIFTLQKE